MFEDLARNLEVPHQLGMTTVLVVPDGQREVFREDWELEGRDAAACRPCHRRSDRISCRAGEILSARRYPAFDESALLPLSRQTALSNDNAKDTQCPPRSPIDHRRRLRRPRRHRPATKGAVRDAVQIMRSTCSTPARRAWPSSDADGAWQVHQWLKKAVLLSFRLNDMSAIAGGPGKAVVVGQGAVRNSTAGARTVSRRRLPRRARRRRAPLGLHRAERGADAVLRQSRRLCRCRHHGRYLGHGRLLRPDRQERAISPAASASAACWSRCRPSPSSSRTIASSARARKSPKA